MSKGKIILIDWGMILHRTVFSWKKTKTVDLEYIALNQILSLIRKVGLDRKDIVIVAADSEKGSWRRDVIWEYKANRKEKRDSHKDLNWKSLFNSFDMLLGIIELGTPFHVIKINKLEADDIIAYATKYYANKECVIVGTDKDFELLWARPNVKLFSPLVKHKGRKGGYKIKPSEKYPERLLEKKIKREASDNLVSKIETKEDYELRKMVVDLINLPNFVEVKVKKELDKIKNNKQYNYELIAYSKLRRFFLSLFYKDYGRVRYEDCLKEKKGGKQNGKNSSKS